MRSLRPLALCCAATAALVILGCRPADSAGAAGPPEAAVRHNILGTALLGQQKWIDAENAFRAAVESGAVDPIPHNNIGVALVQQGKIDEAVAAPADAKQPGPRGGDFEQLRRLSRLGAEPCPPPLLPAIEPVSRTGDANPQSGGPKWKGPRVGRTRFYNPTIRLSR